MVGRRKYAAKRFSSTISAWLLAACFALHGCAGDGCNPKNEVYQRGNDPWVIRATLDQQPRMLILALDAKLWIAYDAQRAALYRVAPAGVSFDGAVYNTHHGPQPATQAPSALTSNYAEPWHVLRDGADERPAVSYLGHRFDGPHVTLRYALKLAKGETIEVEETPEVLEGGTASPRLERRFELKHVPAGTSVALDFNAVQLASLDDVRLTEKGEQLVGRLLLRSDGATRMVMQFPAAAASTGSAQETGPKGARLIAASDCATCHNPVNHTVGPSYKQVAQRYKTNPNVIAGLAAKIRQGGADQWGDTAMVAHPNLSGEDAAAIAEYILTNFDPEDALGEETSHPLSGEPSTTADLDVKKLVSGVAAEIFEIGHPLQELPSFARETPANASFLATQVQFESAGSFRREQPSTGFVLRLRGVIRADTPGDYGFSVEHTGLVSFKLGGRDLIREASGAARTASTWSSLQLDQGLHAYELTFVGEGDIPYLALRWEPPGGARAVIPADHLLAMPLTQSVAGGLKGYALEKGVAGRGRPLRDVHPSFDLQAIRPHDFKPMVGGIDFLGRDRAVVSVWDARGSIYELSNLSARDPEQVVVRRIADGLCEPLGLKVVDGQIYVLQKHELTRLVDRDGDHVIDDYQTVSNRWGSSGNFHEFAFGLAYRDGYFYATLAIGIEPGGAAMSAQNLDRGRVIKIAKDTGAIEYVARGLRTPNGIGFGVDGELFATDNEGDWLPANKLVHVRPGAFFGSFSVEPEVTKKLAVSPPAVWLPVDQIANSPSQPLLLDVGPYKQQMLYGDVTYGGLNRVVLHKVAGEYQGCALPFTQGLEAGINRAVTGPDGSIYVGGIGNPGNWAQEGKLWYGLQRLAYNGKPAFEMLDLEVHQRGIDITLTEPMRVGDGERPEDYLLKQWHYVPTPDYGGPKVDEEVLAVESVRISGDRRRVFLSVAGLKTDHVLHVQLRNAPLAQSGRELWTSDAFCTLNALEAPASQEPTTATQSRPNTLSAEERQQGTILLFDGKTSNAWQGHRNAHKSGWVVKDGFLVTQGAGGVDLVTRELFGDFALDFEWKVEKGANSGLFYRAGDDHAELWRAGLEMQLLDDQGHSDGSSPLHRAGALYDLFAPGADVVHEPGEINQGRIVVRGTQVEHWLNGHKVLGYDMTSDTFQRQLQQSKFAELETLGDRVRGRIGLQHHGPGASFRNIKLRPL